MIDKYSPMWFGRAGGAGRNMMQGSGKHFCPTLDTSGIVFQMQANERRTPRTTCLWWFLQVSMYSSDIPLCVIAVDDGR
jgi:hypothetical protein